MQTTLVITSAEQLMDCSSCVLIRVEVTLFTLRSSTMSVTQRSLGATVLFCSRCERRTDMSSPPRRTTVPPLLTVRYWSEVCRCNTWRNQRTLHNTFPWTDTLSGDGSRKTSPQSSWKALRDEVLFGFNGNLISKMEATDSKIKLKYFTSFLSLLANLMP